MLFLDYEDSPQYEAEPVYTEDSDADSLPLHKKKSTKGHNQPKMKCSKRGASQKKESYHKNLVSIDSEQCTSQSDNIVSSEDEKYSVVCENENIVCEKEHVLEETVDDITAPVLSEKGINSAIKALKDGRNKQFADQVSCTISLIIYLFFIEFRFNTFGGSFIFKYFLWLNLIYFIKKHSKGSKSISANEKNTKTKQSCILLVKRQ